MNAIQRLLWPSAAGLTLLCLLGGLSSGFGYQNGLWELGTGFNLLKWSVYGAIGGFVLAVISLVARKRLGTNFALGPHLLVLALAGAMVAYPYVLRQEFRKLPTIADATTSISNAPTFVALKALRVETAKNPLDYRGGEATALQQEYFPQLVTLESDKSVEMVIQAAEQAVTQMGMELVDASATQGRLEATATTFWFGFKDDVVVRAVAGDSGKTLVDVRSASRVGFLDGGVNGKRVEQLLSLL